MATNDDSIGDTTPPPPGGNGTPTPNALVPAIGIHQNFPVAEPSILFSSPHGSWKRNS